MKKITYFLYFSALCAAQTPTFDEELFTWSRTFAELMHLVNTSYYVTVSPQEALFKAMNAFISFDPHSKFLDPKAYQDIKNVTNGQFFGIGVLLSPKEPHEATVTISDCVPESPAYTAGIKPNDLLIALDKTPLMGLTIDEITEKIKGVQGSTIELTILRNGTTIQVPVKRDTIKDHDAHAYHLTDHRCVYIALRTFTSNSARQLEKALTYAQNNNSNGVIIDVRDNTGGLLHAAVDCAALFLPEKSIVVYTKNKEQKIIETFATNRAPLNLNNMPIFILVNHQTASAAEIFAGSLKKHPTLYTFLVGTQTFGKGSVQPLFPLSNGCAVKLTHALYYLGNGTTIQGIGIEPDFIIEKKVLLSDDTKTLSTLFGNEGKLHNSIKQKGARTKKTVHPEENWKTKLKKNVTNDHHVQVSVSLMQLLHEARANKQHDLSTPLKAYAFLFHRQPFTDTIDSDELVL